MNTYAKTILLLGLVFCFMSCERDNTLEEEIEGNEGTLTGLIVDENQQPIPEATIEIVGNTATTDALGFFRIPEAAMSENGGLIKVTKEGYIDGYKFGFMEANQTTIIKVQLVQNQVIGEVNSDTGGLIEIASGATLMLPPSAVALESGEAYTGQIRVQAHYYNPQGGENLAETMPGDLRGIDSTGSTVQLLTYGMVSIDLLGENGQELQLKEGFTATLSFPLASSEAPDEIPMWFLDEETGMWREEGFAIRNGDFYVGEVSHFSFWNCDFPGRQARISGRLITSDGTPIPGLLISISNKDLNIGGTGYTNENGMFTGFVPAGISLSLSILDCTDNSFDLGILSADTFLGDLTLSDDNVFRISGQILDCDFNPNPNGFLIVRSENKSVLFPPSEDGQFDVFITDCEASELTLVALDFESGASSNTITIQSQNNQYSFEPIDVCGEGQFISFNIDEQVVVLEEAEVTILDGTHVSIFAKNQSTGDRMKVTLPLDPNGSNLPMGANGPHAPAHVEIGQSERFGKATLTLESPQVTKVGDLIQGNISTTGGSDISFRLYVDNEITTSTLILRAWTDSNENGLQDSNEQGQSGIAINIFPRDPDLEFSSYFESFPSTNRFDTFSDEEGLLHIYGIVPDSEHYLFYSPLNQEATLANVGSDDSIDSDFIETSASQFESQKFTLMAREVKTDIDIGILE